jgi:hypothetical protein
MNDKLALTKRKRLLLAAVVMCAVLVGGSLMWFTRQTVEAALVYPSSPGLVGRWGFDEGTGTVAKDSSGNGNHGTVYGATWVDGRYGKALSFDGVNDYLEIGDKTLFDFGSGNFSLIAFISPKGSQLASYAGTIISKGSGYMINIFAATNVYEYYVYTGSGYGLYHAVSPGVPQMVALVRSGDVMYAYCIDETTYWSTSTAISGSVITAGAKLLIGNVEGSSRPLAANYVDEVHVYNRALSSAEIQEIFQENPNFASRYLVKVPKGTTQFMVTLSWKGIGSINATIESPSKNYTEDDLSLYQRSSYSSSDGDMLNIKRLALSVAAVLADENWYVVLKFENVENYKMTVEIQK